MLEAILTLLKHVKGDTDSIRVAQGKYHLPDTFKEGWKQAIKEHNWK